MIYDAIFAVSCILAIAVIFVSLKHMGIIILSRLHESKPMSDQRKLELLRFEQMEADRIAGLEIQNPRRMK